MRTLLWLACLLLACLPASAQLFVYSSPSNPVPASYFGIESTHPQTTSPALIPAGTLRTWDASGWGQANNAWCNIETSSGTFTWTVLDNIVSGAQAQGIPDILYTFGCVPGWNSSNPSDGLCSGGYCDPNASDAAFVTFANALVQRYCGTIKYYEGWNEANSNTNWNSSFANLVTYMGAAYTAVHSTSNCACLGNSCSPGLVGGTNPNQMLLPPLSSPAFFTSSELGGGSAGYNINLSYWLASYLAAGASSTFDIAGLHSYGSASTCYANPETYVVDIANFKQVLAQRNLNPPIWATEANWGLNTCISGDAAEQSWIARFYLIHWVTGIQRVIWYTYDASGTYGTITPSSAELTTYQFMQKFMVGASEAGCQQFSNGNWICTFTRPSPSGYEAYAVWNSTGSGSYTVPSGVTQYRNVAGAITSTTGGSVVALTTSPLFFETQAAF